jgi:hypothetical protein
MNQPAVTRKPGDFVVECRDCGRIGSFKAWVHVIYCRVSGEGARVCPNPECGGEYPQIISEGN